jgi:hypothetical protein
VADGPDCVPFAFTCGSAHGHAIDLSAHALRQIGDLPDSELMIAYLLAHALAEIVRMPNRGGLDEPAREYRADELAMYHLATVNYDCERAIRARRSFGGLADYAAMERACQLA